MFILFLLFINLLCLINAFIPIKKSPLCKTVLNISRQPVVLYNEFNKDEKTYTILSTYNNRVEELINTLETHKVSYIFIDIYLYSKNDIKEICKYYSIELNTDYEKSIFVFLEDKKYIGSEFELYEIISRY